jgi:hypothetical protein
MDDAASYGYAAGAGLRSLDPIGVQLPKEVITGREAPLISG